MLRARILELERELEACKQQCEATRAASAEEDHPTVKELLKERLRKEEDLPTRRGERAGEAHVPAESAPPIAEVAIKNEWGEKFEDVGRGECVDEHGRLYKFVTFVGAPTTVCQEACWKAARCLGYQWYKYGSREWKYCALHFSNEHFVDGVTIAEVQAIVAPLTSSISIWHSTEAGDLLLTGSGPIASASYARDPGSPDHCYRKIPYPDITMGSESGYCEPWGNRGGDLCRPGSLVDHVEVSGMCNGVSSDYYLPAGCDFECAKRRCDTSPFCTGMTERISGRSSTYKLKTLGISKNPSYKCYAKANYM